LSDLNLEQAIANETPDEAIIISIGFIKVNPMAAGDTVNFHGRISLLLRMTEPRVNFPV
jgi:hypothetical protein